MVWPLGFQFDIIPAIIPVDLQTAANNGDWLNMKHCAGVCIIVFKAAGTAGDDPVISLEQATDVAGAGAKALSAIRRVYSKQGTLTAVGAWTETTQAAAATFSANDTSAESQGLYVFSVDAEMLDREGAFDCMRVKVADVGGNAQLGCALYIPYGLRYPSAPQSLPSMIV